MDIKGRMAEVFRAVVAREIERAHGKKADAYKAVATRTGIQYAYIYQLFTGKSGQREKVPGAAAYDSLVRAYAHDEDFSDLFVDGPLRPTWDASPSVVLVEGYAEKQLIEALQHLDSAFANLAPVLVQPARDAVAKWARGEAGPIETAAMVEAFQKASAALPHAPAAVSETPVKAKIK